MITNYLGLTRNHFWNPNRLTTQKYSTRDRCEYILNRSLIFGYVKLAYNTDSVLLLKDIISDIRYEIKSIRDSSIREEGVYESSNDGMQVSTKHVQDVLSICDMLIGDTRSSLDVDFEIYIKDSFFRTIAEYYNMVYKKVEGEETIKSMQSVYIKVLKRSGMGIYCVPQLPNAYNSLVTLDSTKLSDSTPNPNIIDFMSCFTFVNANTDNYLCWLACMCIEPDKNMCMNGYSIPLDFINKWFKPSSIDETISRLSSGDTIAIEAPLNGNMSFVLDFLVKLKDRQNVSLGQVTNMVLKSALTGRNYIDKAIVYVLEILTSKKVKSNDEGEITGIDQEYVDAFKSSDLYLKELDITSEYFIDQFAAEDDPTEGEDPAEEPVEGETPTDDPAEDQKPEEDTPLEDEGSDTDNPDEGEESSEPTEVSKTNDSKGIELSVQEGQCTLDEYLYRREVGFILTQLIENPPKKMSAEKLAILRDIKTRWLYIYDVKTIHNVLSKIIDLKIKVKTKQVA